jgi:hypothetical protein
MLGASCTGCVTRSTLTALLLSFGRVVVAIAPTQTPELDDVQSWRAGGCAFCIGRTERERGGAPARQGRGQSASPALAGITGALRAWTVAMISSMSIPCR